MNVVEVRKAILECSRTHDIQALIELGADIDAKTKIEWTCLHLVSSDDILEIAEVFDASCFSVTISVGLD